MIYFKKDLQNYIYIHIPKTAGYSIINAILNKIDNSEYLKDTWFKSICKSTITKYLYPPFHGHIPVWYINPLLKIDNVKYISVVRNPWARMFSLFQHTMLRQEAHTIKYISNLKLDTRHEYSPSFEIKALEEMNKIGSENLKETFKFWLFFIGRNKQLIPQNNPNFNIIPQNWWLFNEDNSISSCKIFKYETLYELEEFLNLKLPIYNQNRFRSNENYKYAYTKDTIEYVANLDKWVITRFGYKFDD
tara:strand:+ start:958 stop:1698 length:741 start_codon:yes stop_codon:yes gene_type:complete